MDVDTRTALRERSARARADRHDYRDRSDLPAIAAPTPAVGTGTVVMLMLGVLLLAMLAWWAVARTAESGILSSALAPIGDLFRGSTQHFCRVNTC